MQNKTQQIKKITLLILNRQFCLGGAERQIVNLLKGLNKEVFEIIVAPYYEGGPLYDEVLKIPGITCLPLKKRGRWDVFGFLFRYFSLLNSIKPDLVYGFMDSPNLLSLFAKLWGAKSIWGIRHAGIELRSYEWTQKLLTKLEILFSPYADAIICNSVAGSKYIESLGFPSKRIRIVPNGIDVEKFRPNPIFRQSLRQTWGIGDQHTLVGIIGRLDPMKDHFTFLESAAQLVKRKHNMRFICIGSGNTQYQDELQLRAKILGINSAMTWLPAQKDIEHIYSAIDILCLSSVGEGFPNVIGEAMACGVPCIATNVGDAAIILNNPKRIARPRDTYGLSEALEQVYNDLHTNVQNTALQSRQRIIDNFSIEKMVSQTTNTLIDIRGH